MKNLILLFILCVAVAMQGKAQFLRYSPEELNGYVMIENSRYQKFESWKLEVFKRESPDDIHYTDKLVFKQMVIGQSYCKLPDCCKDSSYYIVSVTGLDKEGKPVDSDTTEIGKARDWDGGTNYQHGYETWICNGWQYSYAIDSHRRLNNGQISDEGYLSLEPHMVYTDPKYYIYYHGDDWISLANENSYMLTERHDLRESDLSNIDIDYEDNIKIVKINNVDASHDLRDWNGNVITTTGSGSLIGVRKTRGPWAGYGIKTNDFGPIRTYWTTQNAAGNLYAHASPAFTYYNPPLQELQCVGYNSGSPLVNPPSALALLSDIEDVYYPESDCPGPLSPGEGVFDDIYGLIDRIGKARNGGNNEIFTWPESVDRIDIVKMDDNAGKVLCLYRDSIVDESGTILPPEFNMEKGLYTIGFTHNDKSHNYSLIEVKKRVHNTLDISDFYDVSVFPVPIKEPYFYISMNSDISDDINYTLYDHNGKPVYTEKLKFSAGKGACRIKISPKNGVPRGTLINRFVFSDGSALSIQSIKE